MLAKLVAVLSLALLAGAAPLVPAPQNEAKAAAQTDLPPVRLPLTPHAAKLGQRPQAILTIEQNGRMTGSGRVLLEPIDVAKVDAAALAGVRAWMIERAGEMKKAAPSEGSPLKLPDGVLLLRVDAFAPFELVQSVMEVAGSRDVALWRIELAVEPLVAQMPPVHASSQVGDVMHAHLPVDLDVSEPVETLELVLRVAAQGARVAPDGAPWTPESGELYRFDGERQLSYSLGPRRFADFEEMLERLRELRLLDPERPLTIDARAGVTQAEVIAAMNAGIDAGFPEMTFVGRYR